ncbi:hypothetical protein [Aneurinibacillus tyrosinisolvens]|uniref:hypothetical protein n=1 Tax=Aneurinibacillus tyrosinisolvens TaxID=1443435 RepID=UPI00063F1B1B|nr:hypothetical protein [Aneurinibacillus tyrosinisolvens]
MFDPTIYENIKVALEGAIYDLDLSGEVLVVSRNDVIELSAMSREYAIGFQDRKSEAASRQKKTAAKIILAADTRDLAGEILELPEGNETNKSFGCTIKVIFLKEVVGLDQCREIEDMLDDVWSYRPHITQRLSFYHIPYTQREEKYEDEITLDFGRKINEENIEDLFSIIEHTVLSLRKMG